MRWKSICDGNPFTWDPVEIYIRWKFTFARNPCSLEISQALYVIVINLGIFGCQGMLASVLCQAVVGAMSSTM